MADSKLSELTEATSLGQSDDLYVVQGGVSKKVPISKLGNVIKLTNIEVQGLGYQHDSQQGIWRGIRIYDKTDSLNPIAEINFDRGLLIRSEVTGDTTVYKNLTWDTLANLSEFLSYDRDTTEITTGDSYIDIKDKTTGENVSLSAQQFDITNANNEQINFGFKHFLRLMRLIPDGTSIIKMKGGHYLNPAYKEHEALIMEVHVWDSQTDDITPEIKFGARYGTDGIEFYHTNADGTSTYTDCTLSITELAALMNIEDNIQDQLDALDARITALEQANNS